MYLPHKALAVEVFGGCAVDFDAAVEQGEPCSEDGLFHYNRLMFVFFIVNYFPDGTEYWLKGCKSLNIVRCSTTAYYKESPHAGISRELYKKPAGRGDGIETVIIRNKNKCFIRTSLIDNKWIIGG
ncbi:MAG: hypothetical protein C0392_15040 [Syntrophus sp. (in: bacteria)]|nr:hypothetical protein [Syntrophus sp. (in: bacteria)]